MKYFLPLGLILLLIGFVLLVNLPTNQSQVTYDIDCYLGGKKLEFRKMKSRFTMEYNLQIYRFYDDKVEFVLPTQNCVVRKDN